MLLEQVVLSLGHVSAYLSFESYKFHMLYPTFFFWYVINFIEK